MDLLAVGRITGSHGLKGVLRCKSLSGEVDHLSRLRTVYIKIRGKLLLFNILSVSGAPQNVLLSLEGIDSPEAAKELSGQDIWVERSHASPLAEGEYYLADICRCRVLRDGREVGRVQAVCEGGKASFLEVKYACGETMMVPFTEQFIGEVKIQEGIIALQEGCLLP